MEVDTLDDYHVLFVDTGMPFCGPDDQRSL
jgi:hypothetical protein